MIVTLVGLGCGTAATMTAEAAEASAHRRSIDVPCAASRATGRARL